MWECENKSTQWDLYTSDGKDAAGEILFSPQLFKKKYIVLLLLWDRSIDLTLRFVKPPKCKLQWGGAGLRTGQWHLQNRWANQREWWQKCWRSYIHKQWPLCKTSGNKSKASWLKMRAWCSSTSQSFVSLCVSAAIDTCFFLCCLADIPVTIICVKSRNKPWNQN